MNGYEGRNKNELGGGGKGSEESWKIFTLCRFLGNLSSLWQALFLISILFINVAHIRRWKKSDQYVFFSSIFFKWRITSDLDER